MGITHMGKILIADSPHLSGSIYQSDMRKDHKGAKPTLFCNVSNSTEFTPDYMRNESHSLTPHFPVSKL